MGKIRTILGQFQNYLKRNFSPASQCIRYQPENKIVKRYCKDIDIVWQNFIMLTLTPVSVYFVLDTGDSGQTRLKYRGYLSLVRSRMSKISIAMAKNHTGSTRCTSTSASNWTPCGRVYVSIIATGTYATKHTFQVESECEQV